MTTRAYIAALVSMMVNAVVFGIGATTVLSVPSLSAQAATLLPIVIIISFVVSPFIGWAIAPTLRARWQRAHAKREHASFILR